MYKDCVETAPRRLLLGVSGASGMPLALALLRAMDALKLEVHLVISRAARRVLQDEGGPDISAFYDLAAFHYEPEDMAAPLASGSWKHDGMIVCPCSMSSLGHMASGAGSNLIHRAADVCLKEGRPLVLVARETPLSQIHLRNMLELSRAGAVIFPPCPAFYNQPRSLEEMLDNMAGRILDSAGVDNTLGKRWGEA